MNYQVNTLAEKISGKSLLTDTNFIIDASYFTDDFWQIIDTFKAVGVSFISIVPVVAEFLCGNSSKEDYDKKKNFLFSIIEKQLVSVDTEVEHILMEKTLYEYGVVKAHATDLLLASVLMKYSDNETYLLTGDYNGFPLKLFNLIGVFPVETKKQLKTYGIFSVK